MNNRLKNNDSKPLSGTRFIRPHIRLARPFEWWLHVPYPWFVRLGKSQCNTRRCYAVQVIEMAGNASAYSPAGLGAVSHLTIPRVRPSSREEADIHAPKEVGCCSSSRSNILYLTNALPLPDQLLPSTIVRVA